jgi:hypothetical protein
MNYWNYNLGIPDSGHNPSTDQPNMQINNDNIVVNEFANNVDETFANVEEDNTNL